MGEIVAHEPLIMMKQKINKETNLPEIEGQPSLLSTSVSYGWFCKSQSCNLKEVERLRPSNFDYSIDLRGFD